MRLYTGRDGKTVDNTAVGEVTDIYFILAVQERDIKIDVVGGKVEPHAALYIPLYQKALKRKYVQLVGRKCDVMVVELFGFFYISVANVQTKTVGADACVVVGSVVVLQCVNDVLGCLLVPVLLTDGVYHSLIFADALRYLETDLQVFALPIRALVFLKRRVFVIVQQREA